MKNLFESLEVLDSWAIANRVDLGRELSAIESKIKQFIKQQQLMEMQQRTASIDDSSNEEVPSCHGLTPESQSAESSSGQVAAAPNIDLDKKINFRRRCHKVKGLSLCAFCNLVRLECSKYTLLSGNSAVVCGDCSKPQNRDYRIQNKMRVGCEDALNWARPGGRQPMRRTI